MYTRDETLTRVINDPTMKERMPVRFFRERYFPAGEALETTYARVTKFKSKNRIAKFSLSRLPAHVMSEENATSEKFEPALIKLKTPITAESAAEQDGGDNILRLKDGDTKYTSLEARKARILKDLRTMIESREEMMCVDTLSGGFSYTDDGVTVALDFEFPAANKITLTGGDVWGTGTEDKVADIESAIQTIEDNGGIVKEIVFGRNAWARFKNDANVIKLLDTNNLRVGALDETNRTDKYTKGTWNGYPVFKVSETALDTDGVTTIDLVNPNGVWVIGEGIETDMVYGLIAMYDEEGNLLKVMTDVYAREYVEGHDVQTKYIFAAARPLPIIGNPEQIVYIDTE